ncbi:MAG: hypothetical protein WBX25_00085 [Rhodomicrobium sp.]
MTIDDKLRARIEAVLRKYTPEEKREKPDFESRIAYHAGTLAHLAIIAMCIELEPPRISRKAGQRGASRTLLYNRYETALCGPAPDHCAHVADYSKRQPLSQAHQFFMDALCSTYFDLTGTPPTRSTKRGKFGAFAADMHKATQMKICLAYAVQRACEKYTERRFIFSSQ